MAVGAGLEYDFAHNLPLDDDSFDVITRLAADPSLLWTGLPFSLTLLAIFLAHEMGHYLACMRYGVEATLPYFVPAPPEVGGTLGAFIRIRSAIYARRDLFDIGIAGPLAGFVFVLPTLGIGLALSKIIPGIAGQGSIQLGDPLLLLILERAIFPGVPPADIALHPVAVAGWVGILATALNLLPIGQSDGGHILYAITGDRHGTLSKVCTLLLVPLGIFVWWFWLVWAAALFWLGRRHPAIVDPAPLGGSRVRFALLGAAVFLLCFTAAPTNLGGLMVWK